MFVADGAAAEAGAHSVSGEGISLFLCYRLFYFSVFFCLVVKLCGEKSRLVRPRSRSKPSGATVTSGGVDGELQRAYADIVPGFVALYYVLWCFYGHFFCTLCVHLFLFLLLNL